MFVALFVIYVILFLLFGHVRHKFLATATGFGIGIPLPYYAVFNGPDWLCLLILAGGLVCAVWLGILCMIDNQAITNYENEFYDHYSNKQVRARERREPTF